MKFKNIIFTYLILAIFSWQSIAQNNKETNDYCYSWGNFDNSTKIMNVTFADIDNDSGKPSDANGHAYSDYTETQATSILQGENTAISVKMSGLSTVYARAWIDWNQNGYFNDSGEEYDIGSVYSSTGAIVSLSFTVPTTAKTGKTRMRVSADEGYYPNSCTIDIDGEVEDYTVYVVSDNYCTSWGNNNTNVSTVNVEFNTINNSSGKPLEAGIHAYSDYMTITTDVTKEEVYDLSVTVNNDNTWKTVTTAWIDWNQDGDFDDTGEEYDLGTAAWETTDVLTTNSPLSITIPATAETGFTVMRITTSYGGAEISCETDFDGEVEDYYINVEAVPSTDPIATATITAGCGTGSVTISSNLTGNQYFYLFDGAGSLLDYWSGDASSHEFTGLNDGVYKGKVKNDGIMSPYSSDVTLTNYPNPTEATSVTATNTTITSGESTILSYSGGSGTTFKWYSTSCGSGLVGNGNNLLVSPTSTTTYYGRWENACGNSSCKSVTITVTSGTTFTIPYTQDFESVTFPPDGWTKDIIDVSNDITRDDEQNNTSGGNYSARFSSLQSSSDYNQYLYTPAFLIPTNCTLKFWHKKFNGDAEDLQWGVATTTNSDDYTWTSVSLSENDWQQTVIDLSSYAGQTVHIGFHYYGDYLYYVYLDDVELLKTSNVLSLESGIKVFPNPSNGRFNIKFTNDFSKGNISISDITGKVIYSNVLTPSIKQEIDLGSQTKGVYFIKLNIDGETYISKLILK